MASNFFCDSSVAKAFLHKGPWEKRRWRGEIINQERSPFLEAVIPMSWNPGRYYCIPGGELDERFDSWQVGTRLASFPPTRRSYFGFQSRVRQWMDSLKVDWRTRMNFIDKGSDLYKHVAREKFEWPWLWCLEYQSGKYGGAIHFAFYPSRPHVWFVSTITESIL